MALSLLRWSGARLQLSQLRRLHACEQGGVQSLSLVLTLPVFVLFLMFIVQIAQLMTGVMVVNYAAFAAARTASVWVPADVLVGGGTFDDLANLNTFDPITNQLIGPPERANVIVGNPQFLPVSGNVLRVTQASAASSNKLRKVWQAAVLACLPIAPSRNVGAVSNDQWVSSAQQVIPQVYASLNPRSRTNGLIPQRIRNKLNYAAAHTFVTLDWTEEVHPQRDVDYGPTYNPRNHPGLRVPPWNPNEVGFRDPLTVTVTHQYALLPGIGRILAKLLITNEVPVDRVSPRIVRGAAGAGLELYFCNLEAKATLVNEGFKSPVRYAFEP